MTDEQYEELLRLVHGRAGDAFRGAFRFDADGWTPLYVREDLATDELRDALGPVIENIRDSAPLVPEDLYAGLGGRQATVELHERAAVVLLPESARAGVVISLDRDVAQGLGEFVKRCNAVLDDENRRP